MQLLLDFGLYKLVRGTCLDWRPRWITPSKICFIIHSKYFQLKKMLYTLINEKLPSSQYYWNDEYINFRYWKSGMKDIKCKEDHHSRSLHLFLYSAVPIYKIHMFIISSLPFLGILQTNLMTWLATLTAMFFSTFIILF